MLVKQENNFSVNVNNTGSNSGIEVGANSGVIIEFQGLGYSDTKAVCLDIVKEELKKYHAEALEESKKRSEELLNRFEEKLSAMNINADLALSEFKTPAMQLDYLEAQKAYIKVGTDELKELLSDILVKRVHEHSRSLLQIALGEAIQVIPKLVPSQMTTLALLFVAEHKSPRNINNHVDFSNFLRETMIEIFSHGISRKRSEFQHLSFTGCILQSPFSIGLVTTLERLYAGLFMKGMKKTDIPKTEDGVYLNILYPELFDVCRNDSEKIQIAVMDKTELEKKIGSKHKYYNMLIKMFEDNIMPDAEAKLLIETLVPEMKEIFAYWNESYIGGCEALSVGIVIGAEYAKQITGEEYNLEMWI